MSKPVASSEEHLASLAQLAASASIENLPNSVVHAGRRILIDGISAILAGVREKPMASLAKQMASDSILQQSAVLGTQYRSDAAWAALVNATAGVWHQLDPGNRFTGGHPAIHAIAAGLAVAEREKLSGKKMLEAVIAGYEIGARVGLATTLRPGMHPHGSWTVVGAAVTAGLLMGNDRAGLMDVINLSTSLNLATSCQTAYEGATILNIYAGFSAAMGILAADLKHSGFSAERDGIRTVFGSIAGVFYDADKAVADIGTKWEIERGYHTTWACDRRIHSALEALMTLVKEENIPVEKVDRIIVQTFNEASRLNDMSPQNPSAAKRSIPHVLASYLVLREPGLASCLEKTLHDQSVQDLAARIQLREDPELTGRTPTEWPARIIIKLRSGRDRKITVFLPAGEFDTKPLGDEALIEKFRSLALKSFRPQTIDQMIDLLGHVEDLPDIGQFIHLTSKIQTPVTVTEGNAK
jgi:2-methylcitrate dehydratase PrpD